MTRDLRPVLITGGAGFIGANLADRLAAMGLPVIVHDALTRPGVEANVEWLTARHGSRIEPVIADIRDRDVLADSVTRAQAVFHLAAQVAVTTSIADPLEDFAVNLGGTIGLLEAVRRCADPPPVIFASTNKVYGDLADLDLVLRPEGWVPDNALVRRHGISEARPLDFHTPYGCSKGAADQYVIDYTRSFGLKTAVLRMSCIYGERQFGTEDQGWVAHFLIRALAGQPITLYGDGHQVRDVLYVGDAVDAYVALWQRMPALAGRAYNLGGGPENAVSLNRLIDHVAHLRGGSVAVVERDWRPGDQRWFVADTRAVRRALGLGPARPWREGVAALHRWLAGRDARADDAMLAELRL